MRFCQKGSERDKRLIDRGVSLVVGDDSSLNTSKVFETDYYFHLTLCGGSIYTCTKPFNKGKFGKKDTYVSEIVLNYN